MKTTYLLLSYLILISACERHSSETDRDQQHVHTHPHNKGLIIADARVRATAPHMQNTTVYFAVMNPLDQDIDLVNVSSDTIERVEIHAHTMQDGLMKMEKIDALTIPKKSTLLLEPGGYHIMLMDLKHPINAGEQIILTLTFNTGATKTISAIAKKNMGTTEHEHGAGY
ncbi:MAG: copper chaperone PCu(A)C [Cellvibrionaceae bacterium]|nr:copper chaperone PCu(A)C [Cellvibrionaceae bacterium]